MALFIIQQIALAAGLGFVLLLFGSVALALTAVVSGEGTRTIRGSAAVVGTVALASGLTMCLLPGLIGLIVALLVGVATGIAIYQRSVGERLALDRAVGLALAQGIPLERLGFAFARTRRDLLGQRAQRFAEAIEAGVAPDRAAAIAGLRLSPAVRSRLARPAGFTPAPQGGQPASPPAPDTMDRADDLTPPGIWIGGLYLAVLLTLMSLLALLIQLSLLRMFREMMRELDFSTPLWLEMVQEAVHYVPLLCTISLAALLLTAVLWWLMSLGAFPGGRWIPLLGPYHRSRHDAQGLEWLSEAIAAGLPLEEMEQELGRVQVGPAEHRLRRAMGEVRNGADWPSALHRSGLISRRSLPWLAVARGGSHLAGALSEVALRRRHRAAYSLKMGMRIVGPVVLALAALPVLLCGLLLIGMLSHMVLELA